MRTVNPVQDPKALIAIVGPTASGKTKLAIELAQKQGGEIINADSRQFYREMNIGTAKPTPEEQTQARFHLIDCASITAPWDVADFVKAAETAATEIQSRGKLPILCGGTGLYLRAFRDGLAEIPEPSKEIQTEVEQIAKLGTSALYAELLAVDPESAKRIGTNDPQRLGRALAVFKTTGKPIHEFWRHQKTNNSAGPVLGSLFSRSTPLRTSLRGLRPFDRANSSPGHPPQTMKIIGIEIDRSILRERIKIRVNEMMAAGLKQEAQKLFTEFPSNIVLQKTIGYAEFLEHPQKSDQEIATLITTHTAQFAKRQMTWFRNKMTVEWQSIS